MTNQDNHQNNVVQNPNSQGQYLNGNKPSYKLGKFLNPAMPSVKMYGLSVGDHITLAGQDVWCIHGRCAATGKLVCEFVYGSVLDTHALSLMLKLNHLNEDNSFRYESGDFLLINDEPGLYSPVDFSTNPEFVKGHWWLEEPGFMIETDCLDEIEERKSELIGMQVTDRNLQEYKIVDLAEIDLRDYLAFTDFRPFYSATLEPIRNPVNPIKLDLRVVTSTFLMSSVVREIKELVAHQQALEKARRSYVYRMWDKDGILLYVGKSNKPLDRWKQHHRDKTWFEQVTRFETAQYPTEVEAFEAERRAIKTEHPLHNIVHNTGL